MLKIFFIIATALIFYSGCSSKKDFYKGVYENYQLHEKRKAIKKDPTNNHNFSKNEIEKMDYESYDNKREKSRF